MSCHMLDSMIAPGIGAVGMTEAQCLSLKTSSLAVERDLSTTHVIHNVVNTREISEFSLKKSGKIEEVGVISLTVRDEQNKHQKMSEDWE